MSWTRSVAPDAAAGPLAEAYARVRARSGRVNAAWQSLGEDPKGLAALFDLVRTLTDDPAPLSKAQAEMIAIVVSATNGCGYMVAHHGPRLAAALGDEALARAVALDYREANIAARDRVLLDAAVALTCEPGERTEADVERVREYGFDDAAIVKATEIAALYNLIDRIISGLGVTLDADVPPWEFGSQR
ncbi:MAG: peroxidase-related enzyme [Candidatus Eisenbacteria bacterium]|uniref:Peroxidase-related enzyme n=1 Tax=Eiseniibacteriota bacterium TaxID=2212470 RepID=A0A9D6QNB3_UNCEI|nr:peroxidase-related enzyme [Candidatus Eisenbacteria bacterium]MBI3538809.1 peroxidase-related enzyme [Candidatus Eisenbacteria bacterium]